MTPGAQLDEWAMFASELADVAHRLRSKATGADLDAINRHLLCHLAVAALIAQGGGLQPESPRWFPLMNDTLTAGNPNADSTYLITCVDPRYEYRISGDRGTVSKIYLSVHRGFLGFGGTGETEATYDLDKFTLTADGELDLRLGGKPAAQDGNQITFRPGDSVRFLVLRQVAYDCGSETDGRFAIERVCSRDASAPADLSSFAHSARSIVAYIEDLAMRIEKLAERHSQGLALNEVVPVNEALSGLPIMHEQHYFHGVVQLADSQALLIEAIIAPDAEYWSVQLMDTFYNALDFRARQSSLNGAFAVPDADGVVRICVSQRDPGVPNWLDMSGHDRVGLRFRIVQLQSPVIRSRVVDLAEIPRLVGERRAGAELDRAAVLRQRSSALQRRRRW
jgi:Protein of unknown function (DUF1214)